MQHLVELEIVRQYSTYVKRHALRSKCPLVQIGELSDKSDRKFQLHSIDQ
jgi:hypothetical protein